MVEVKVGQKWKSTDWWADVASEKTVEITAIEGDTVYYTPGMFSDEGGYDSRGRNTWEERWELVEDAVENKFKVQDKVRTINSSGYWAAGEEGEILGFANDEADVRVYFPGQDDWWFVPADNLEPVEEEDSFDPENNALSPNVYRFPNGVEVKDISAHLTSFGGQAVQYVARATRLDGVVKGLPVQDLYKAIELLRWEAERLEALEEEK